MEDSIGILEISGAAEGSAWMVTADLALTAWHCFGDPPNTATVQIRFGEVCHDATVLDFAPELDVALLCISASSTLPPPLPLAARPPEGAPECHWKAHGYPDRMNTVDSGISIGGIVRNFDASSNGIPSVQLLCEDIVNVPDFSTSILGGMSGAPATADLDGEACVFALVYNAPEAAAERIILGVQIEAILTRFRALENVSVRSWNSRFVIVSLPDGRVRSNIDDLFLGKAWTSGIRGIWCNIPSDESEALTCAVARLLLHAPFSSGQDAFFPDPFSWRDAISFIGRKWIPVAAYNVDERVGRFQWVRLPSPSPQDGKTFASLLEVVAEIHHLCDQWILRRMRERMQSLLLAQSTIPALNFEIASDLRDQMKGLWGRWRLELEQDSILLHHFLALFVTENGDYDSNTASPGVGPATLETCIIRPLAFVLALSSCVNAIEDIKHPTPGNLGKPTFPGHACGIELFNSKKLHLELGRHLWATQFTLVPNCEHRWLDLRRGELRLNEHEVDATLRHDPPRNIVFTGDYEIHEAMAEGKEALEAYLRARISAFEKQQLEYENKSTKVT